MISEIVTVLEQLDETMRHCTFVIAMLLLWIAMNR
ncbi:hypothetical protein LCGC14_0487040 [marine sediment metagenome]|uniref:Uncharacterized protein n=1 Tax=marine sediment metagenome TaxID=412755 RepID=A0A0F9S7J6_9ZZZZ